MTPIKQEIPHLDWQAGALLYASVIRGGGVGRCERADGRVTPER